jgi:hypothetical protein
MLSGALCLQLLRAAGLQKTLISSAFHVGQDNSHRMGFGRPCSRKLRSDYLRMETRERKSRENRQREIDYGKTLMGLSESGTEKLSPCTFCFILRHECVNNEGVYEKPSICTLKPPPAAAPLLRWRRLHHFLLASTARAML